MKYYNGPRIGFAKTFIIPVKMEDQRLFSYRHVAVFKWKTKSFLATVAEFKWKTKGFLATVAEYKWKTKGCFATIAEFKLETKWLYSLPAKSY